jgi:membrane-associated phospholipid phosphatase
MTLLQKSLLVLLTTVISAHSSAEIEITADEFIERSGDVLQVILPLTALTATYTLDDPEGRKALLWSYGLTFATTHITKRVVGKPRPDGSDDLGFPSGHTSSAFSGASFLAKRYGWDIGVPAYLAASFVGYSRVHAEKHDWWDVAAGAALAIGVNEFVVGRYDDFTVAVQPLPKGYALALNFRY